MGLLALALGAYLVSIPFGFLKPSVNDEKIVIKVGDETVIITSEMLRKQQRY